MSLVGKNPKEDFSVTFSEAQPCIASGLEKLKKKTTTIGRTAVREALASCGGPIQGPSEMPLDYEGIMVPRGFRG